MAVIKSRGRLHDDNSHSTVVGINFFSLSKATKLHCEVFGFPSLSKVALAYKKADLGGMSCFIKCCEHF